MKILHLADFHLGHRCYGIERRQNALKNNFLSNHVGGLNHTIDRIKPDLILIAGDIFDNSNPLHEDTFLMQQWILMTKEKCDIIGITGNHDKQTDSSVQVSQLLGIHDPTVFDLLNIQCFDHMYRSQLKEMAEAIEPCDILMLHQSACGFLPSIMKPEIDEDVLKVLAEKCTYLALGDLHIHRKMQVGECSITYPGALDFLRVGEPHTKFGGWLLEELDNGFVCNSLEIVPYQKTHVIEINDPQHYVHLHQLINEESAFYVIRAIEHPTLFAETKKLLQLRQQTDENFCFILKEYQRKEIVTVEESAKSESDDDFIEILSKDKTIEDTDRKLASDLWSAPAPKAMQSLLSHDLSEELEKVKIL